MSIPTTPLALLTTAALVALGGSAVPAHAESSESIKVRGGKVSFIAHGNGLAARDTRKDGRCMRAIAEWVDRWTNPPLPTRESARVDACGVGTGNLERLRIAEGTRVRIYACYVTRVPGGLQRCSDAQHGTA